jgi:Tfp pilus assembly protein PilO
VARNVEITQEKERLAEALKITDEYRALSAKLREERDQKIGKGEIDKLDKLLPSSIDNIRLFVDLQKIAADYGLPLDTVNISGEGGDSSKTSESQAPLRTQAQGIQSNGGVGVVKFSFNVKTDLATFKSLLQGMEESLRIFDVTDIKISPVTEDGSAQKSASGPAIYTFALSANTYWLK